jgi:PAS domain S-box-containing protein
VFKELSEAQRLAQLGSWHWDSKADLVSWSEQLFRIVGRDPSSPAPCYKELRPLYTPESWEQLERAVEKALRTGTPYELDLEMVRPDKTTRWVCTRGEAERDAMGRITQLRGTVQDITERKQAEEKLRELGRRLTHAHEELKKSEQKFFKAFRESPVALTITSAKDHRYLDVSESFEQWSGWRRDEVIGRTPFDIGIWVNPAGRLEFVRRILAEGVVSNLEFRCRRKHGVEMVGLGSGELIEIGNEQCVISAVADITERKLAERELEQINERLSLAMEAGRIGGWEWNIKDGKSFWFGEALNLLGISGGVHSPSAAEFRDRIHPEDRDWLRNAVQTAMRNHAYLNAEFRVVWPDGCVHWLRSQARFFYGTDGEPERMLGVSVDITEHKQAEETLRESEERLRLAQWAAHIGTFDLDLRTGVDIWTPETEALYGLPLGGFGGTLTAFENLIHPADRERIIALTRAMIETGQPSEAEWRAVWPDGSVHWIAGRAQVFMGESGEPSRMLGVNMDITDRKRAEETISAMTRKLIEGQEQERARIARELHDDISQRLALLATELDQLRGEHRKLPSEIHGQILKLRETTADICSSVYDLSHELHSSTLDLLGLSKGMGNWCKTFGERQKMEIVFKSHGVPELPQEISLCLFRILQEATHNAAKHSGVNRIDVQLSEKSGEIHLIVSDSGKGFDIDTARQKRGLGLTSMQERVRLIGGTIVIESKPLTGTVVHACLPFTAEPRGQSSGG